MSNIRRPDWKDLFRVPVFDIFEEDGKITVPSNEGIPSWGQYSLVAEAPGNNMMGFVTTSIQRDAKDTSSLIGSTDNCRVNRLYGEVGAMKGLVSGMEDVLRGDKISQVEIRLPKSSSSQLTKFDELGYKTNQDDQSMITSIKVISQAQETDGDDTEQYAAAHVGQAVGQVTAAEQYAAGVAHVVQAVGQEVAAADEVHATGVACLAGAMVGKLKELKVAEAAEEQRARREAIEERVRQERARRASGEETGSQEETSTSYASETSTSYAAPTLPHQKRR